jgi:hypothetical protein
MSDDYRIALRPDSEPYSDRLDDVVVSDVSMFRFELMDDRSAWMCCYFPGTDQRIAWRVSVRRVGGRTILHLGQPHEYPRGEGFKYEDDRWESM